MARMRIDTRLITLASVLVISFGLLGCDEEPVRSYRVPKPQIVDPNAGRPPQPPQVVTPQDVPAEPAITFDVPDGWRAATPGRMIDYAFDAGDGPDAPLVTISFFRMQLNIEANVNRWLNQVGEPAVDEASAQALLQPPSHPAYEGYSARFKGKQQSIAMEMLSRGGGWWFIKIQGDTDAVDRELANFKRFAGSVRFDDEGAPE